MHFLLTPVAALGARARSSGRTALDLARFTGAVVRSVGYYPLSARMVWGRTVTNQLRFTAADALPFIVAIAFMVGAILVIEANAYAVRFGVSDLVARILAIVGVRELGPLLTAIVVIGRSGTAIAAELATSRVLGESEALEAMGVDPLHYFVLPRILGAAISVSVLTLLFNAVTVLTGLLGVWGLKQMAVGDYLSALRLALSPTDVIESMVKGAVAGAGIAGLCAYAGLQARRREPTEIPKQVTSGVVMALFFVFLVSAAFAVLRYA